MAPLRVVPNRPGIHGKTRRPESRRRARGTPVLSSHARPDEMPSQVEGVIQPVHQLVLIAMGTPIFDNFDLEALGDAAAKKNRWTFLITVAPLAVPGGTGSPVNPTALF